MVFTQALKLPFKNMKVSRVVLISGLLTFMYCIEFCIGVRTIYYTFQLWSDPNNHPSDRPVSWTLCVGCLLTATVTVISINILSAIWEQKQIEEREKDNSPIRFAFHIFVGGMIWRYVNLWCIESKEFQKKGAVLLTMIKFFFTQAFTIPMVIVHVSVMNHLDELVFDICSIFCISFNLILTCTVFAWCSTEVEELKKWDFETINLIPLIFQTSPTVTTEHDSNYRKDSAGRDVVPKSDKKDASSNSFEDAVIRTVVFFQTFAFSLGRILALGILLKLAGIYALSIMFLQLLISVIYLKFQSPILVSDSLPKWRQLTRLAFMSYILIFEWHLNRDPKTACDFSFNMKHNVFYYCVATVESVFYLVTWAITTSYSSKVESSATAKQQNKSCRVILIIGSLALVFSLTLHILLLFWRSRKISMFLYTVRRRYENTKIRLSRYGCRKVKDENRENASKRPHVDISSPISVKKNDVDITREQSSLEKHNSYRDLREPLDEEIEIYFQKCENQRKDSCDDITHTSITKQVIETRTEPTVAEKSPDSFLSREVNGLKESISADCEKMEKSPTVVSTVTNVSIEDRYENETTESTSEKSLKSKMHLFSGSVSERWGRLSGIMRDRFKRSKGQLQNCRSSSTSDSKTSTPSKTKSSSTDDTRNYASQTPTGETEVTEGYFVGDDRCYQIESLQNEQDASTKRIRFTDETVSRLWTFEEDMDEDTLPASDTNHTDGDSPCPCYICKALGDGRFRRRRSSSVPPADRKTSQDDEITKDSNQGVQRYMSTPNISKSCYKKYQNHISSPTKFTKPALNLSDLSLNNRIEHYV